MILTKLVFDEIAEADDVTMRTHIAKTGDVTMLTDVTDADDVTHELWQRDDSEKCGDDVERYPNAMIDHEAVKDHVSSLTPRAVVRVRWCSCR